MALPTWSDLRLQLSLYSPQQLAEAIPAALIVRAMSGRLGASAGLTAPRSEGELAPVDAAQAHVYPLAKSDRNAFVDMVTFGRAANNDVCFPVSGISNFHAYFRRDFLGWWLHDRSQNGTWRNGVRLEAEMGTPLSCGDRLIFARAVELEFRTANGLYELIHG